MVRIAMLTTVDNPFDPYTDFAHWWVHDSTYGHKCCEITARLARVSDLMSEVEYQAEVERAIDDFLLYDPTGLYKKVVVEVPLESFIAK